ncbi:hypothetical protein XENTR_v10020312 [Xenopus tropicalis]|nr:hypothetical protein XENTR_v10020312 [Xenopus tropicalis]
MAALVICLCFLLGVIPVGAGTQVCESCPGALRNSSQVSQLCRAAPKARTLGRCCLGHMDGSDVIIGLDLWNCSLAQLDPTLHLTQAAVVLDLSSNPLRDLPSEFFRGLLGLQYVAVPRELCVRPRWARIHAVRLCPRIPWLQVPQREHVSYTDVLWDPWPGHCLSVCPAVVHSAPESKEPMSEEMFQHCSVLFTDLSLGLS